jgi:hypothetical protein
MRRSSGIIPWEGDSKTFLQQMGFFFAEVRFMMRLAYVLFGT